MSRYTDMVDARLAAGFCGRCGERPPVAGKKTCPMCAEKARLRMRTKRRRLLLKGKCQNGCGPKAIGHTYCHNCLDRMAGRTEKDICTSEGDDYG